VADPGARPGRPERTEYLAPTSWTPDGRHLIVHRGLPDRTNQIGLLAVHDGSYRAIKSLEWRYPGRVRLSPDGRYVAYAVPAGENGSPDDVFVLAVDGSRETVVVRGPANDTSPLWSPDGSHLLFVSDRTGSSSLWSVPMRDGRPAGEATLVKPDIGRASPLGVTRQGTLYYQLAGADRQNIHTAVLDGAYKAKPPSLATESFVNSNRGPAWSRDGRHLAYYSFRSPPVLVIRTVATGEERTLPLPAGLNAPFHSGPKWFPDCRSMLVLSRDSQGAGFGFYRLVLDTGKTELLWRINVGPSSFDLSPDGQAIFYAQQNNPPGVLNSGRLVRVDVEQRREVELKTNEWFISLAVSPDGSELAYLKSLPRNTSTGPRESGSAIEVISTAGGESREVYYDAVWGDGARYNTLTWSADGRFLLFVRANGSRDRPHVLYRVPAAGGAVEHVGLAMSARIKSPSVHPDGRSIVFGTADVDNGEIWALENFLPGRHASSR
jgi:Tol biopolymer transport system component